MKIKTLTMVALAAIAAGGLSLSEPAEAAKEKFERNKPHVNVGTIGHADGQSGNKTKQPELQPEPPAEKPKKKEVPAQP